MVGVLITLQDANGQPLRTTLTDSNGFYAFVDVPDGVYFVIETNPSGGFTDVGDVDGGNPNNITVSLTQGTGSTGNDFVDERPGSISGSVSDDDAKPLASVSLQLKSVNGTVLATTVTDSNGTYVFAGVPPGNYSVVETNPDDYPKDISDYDTVNDTVSDSFDSDTTVDNIVGVTLRPGEVDSGNDFADSNKGSITGTVTNEVGAPLANVTITLTYPDGKNTTTITGSDGSYQFTGLPPGNYTLTETNPPNYPDDVSDYDEIPDDNNKTDPGDTGFTPPDNVIKIVINPGESDKGNNFVDTALGNVSGQVKEDVDNNDTGDDPLVGVLITLQDANGQPLRTTLTDSNGFYAFVDVPDGVYFVIETNPSGGFTDVGDVDGGNPNNITVSLTQGTGSTGNDFVDERPGSISGSVSDDDAKPLASVSLQLKSVNGTVLATTVTDSNGTYVFAGVPPGNYSVVETNPDDYPKDISDYDTVNDTVSDSFDSDTTVDNIVGVTLRPGEVDSGNDFADSNKGSITGTVTNEVGAPLANVTITLTYPDGKNTTTITGSDGSYQFTGLPPGNYTLTETNPPNYPDDVSDYDEIPDDNNKTDPGDTGFTPPDNVIKIVINPGESDKGNNFVDTALGNVSGQVKEDVDNNDTGDDPLVGVLITLQDANGQPLRTTLTDSNGFYAFVDVPDGVYFVIETNPSGGFTDVGDVDGGNPNNITVSLTQGTGSTGNDFVDERPGSISGSVSDDDAKPLASVSLQLKSVNGTVLATTVTDSNGTYVFAGVPPGNYSVVETNPDDYPKDISDYDTVNDTVSDSFDSDTTVDNIVGVTLRPGEVDSGNDFADSNKGSITGTVTNEVGAPLANVTITLTYPDGKNTTTITGSDGSYQFTGLPPGNYTLTETNPPNYPDDVSDYDEIPDDNNKTDPGDTGFTPPDNVIKIVINPGESDKGNNFVDTALGNVSGQVKEDVDNNDTGDDPLVGVLITLQDANGQPLRTTLTDSNGFYAFVDVPDGVYFVIETNPSGGFTDVGDVDGGNPNNITVSLTQGTGSTGNDFVDERPGSISGSVSDDDAKPLASVSLQLKSVNGTVLATTVTDSNGTYVFAGVPPGNYSVVETNPDDYPKDISDYDTVNDTVSDSFDSDTTVDNIVGVTLRPGEVDSGNDFADSNKGSITGTVTNEVGAPLANVTITLTYPDGKNTTTITGSDGSYQFTGLPPGNYTLTETNPPNYPDDVSDYDEIPDDNNKTDPGDTGFTPPDNVIKIVINPGESDKGNNFVDTALGNVSGQVKEDVDNNDTGDDPLVGVLITLQDANGQPLRTTLTDSNGFYAFVDVPDGVYFVIETNPSGGFTDVGDVDGGNPNNITVSLTQGTGSTGNDFVDERPGSISGSVSDDDAKPLASVSLQLKSVNGTVLATTVTDSNGTYVFAGVPPGNYSVVETNPDDYPKDISDYDTVNDTVSDSFDSDTTVDNIVGVTLRPGEVDSGNDFADSNKGSITGTVTNEVGAPLANVTITLTYPDGKNTTTITGSDGSYQFTGLPPGNYTLTETNPPNYPDDVSDYDEIPDDNNKTDPGDTGFTPPDNVIKIVINPGESDNGNNFKDARRSDFPSVAPSEIPRAPPQPPTLPPSDFCCEVENHSGCSLCAPFRSLGKSFFDISHLCCA